MKRLSPVFFLAGFLVLATGSLAFFFKPDQVAAADTGVNKVDTVFRTAWVYDSPGDNFTNDQITGYKWWGTGVFNLSDDTKAPITSLSLSLESNQIFENLNTKSLVKKGPPTYEWSFGDIPEGADTNTWVDSRQSSGLNSTPVTFTPGFDASRSVNKTKFSTPDIQIVTITVTPREPIQGISIYVGAMGSKDADSTITSPTSNSTTKLSPDGHSLNVNLTDLSLDVTYTTIVNIQVTPKVSEVTFMPQVNVMESENKVASGSDSGNSISHPVGEPEDKVGTWIWRAQDNCLWQWREVLSRWVTFKGITYSPQGQGTGTKSGGPAPAFGWRFDASLAIVLIVISPALYFAGRRFRKHGKSLDLTKIVYPIIISLTGWYILASIYRIIYVPDWNPGAGVIEYVVIWSTVPVAFSYAVIRKVKLEFKWTVLSAVGMILATYFLVVAISEFFNPTISLHGIFFTGIWDHTYFPLSFGLLMLADLNRMPKVFWLILLPMTLVVVSAISVLSELLFGIYILPPEPNAPNLLFYFGVESRAQLLALPQDRLMSSLILFLREELGFLLLIPALVYYYLFKSLWKSISCLIKRHSKSSPSQP